MRRQLHLFIRRGCRQRLLISTEGSFSARLGEDSFLITPTQQDREVLDIADFVLVQGNRREAGKKASRAVFSHQAIYRKHPHVQAIVFAHPVNGTAFSVTDLNLRHPHDPRKLRVSARRAACALRRPVPAGWEHRGFRVRVLAGGNSRKRRRPGHRLQRAGRLRPARSSRIDGRSVINAHAIGKVSAMPDAVIRELREAFGLR